MFYVFLCQLNFFWKPTKDILENTYIWSIFIAINDCMDFVLTLNELQVQVTHFSCILLSFICKIESPLEIKVFKIAAELHVWTWGSSHNFVQAITAITLYKQK